jgi:hypothetical protein
MSNSLGATTPRLYWVWRFLGLDMWNMLEWYPASWPAKVLVGSRQSERGSSKVVVSGRQNDLHTRVRQSSRYNRPLASTASRHVHRRPGCLGVDNHHTTVQRRLGALPLSGVGIPHEGYE